MKILTKRPNHLTQNPSIFFTVVAKLDIMTRRNLATDHSRRFVGVVASTNGNLARLKGYMLVFNPDFAGSKKPKVRTRLFDLVAVPRIINVMTPHTIPCARLYDIINDLLMNFGGHKIRLDIKELEYGG